MPIKYKMCKWAARAMIICGILLLMQGVLNAMGIGIRVVVSNKSANLGTVTSGTKISHQFRLTNYSLQTVNLVVEPSCGCTVVDFSRTWLAPMQSMVVTAQIDTAGMSPGSYHKESVLKMRAGRKIWEEVITSQFHCN